MVLLVVSGGLWEEGPQLIAFSGGEVYGHLWVQWWHGEALPGWPSGTDLALGASSWPVIDPLTTGLAAVVGRLVGGVAAWNILFLAAVVLAFAGGAFLADREGGNPLVGGVVLALAPVFLGSLASGLTEDAGVGLLAFAMGLVFFPRSGKELLLGGVLLGLVAWCGLYLAYMGGLVALALAGGRILREKSFPKDLLVAGSVALLIALPALWLHGDVLSTGGHTQEIPEYPFEPLWRLNPWQGADFASFLAPGAQIPPPDAQLRLHPVYLGFVALLLAVWGGRSRWWWILGACVLVAPGEQWRWCGSYMGGNPFMVLWGWIPFSDMVNHHARLMLVGQLALSVLAARGAARLGRRAPVAAGLVLLEILLLSPAPLPVPTTPAEVDAVWDQVGEGEGKVLPVPFWGPGVNFQRPLFEQRAHSRPLAIHPNRPVPMDLVLETELGAWLAGLAFDESREAPGNRDTAAIRAAGIEVLVVRTAWVDRVEEVLGSPHQEAEGGAIWELARLSFEDGEAP